MSDKPRPSPRLIYSRQYNIGFAGLERLHPFDGRKYARAWVRLRRRYGSELRRYWVKPSRPVSEAELLEVHTPEHLRRLKDRTVVANILELPPLRYLPYWSIDWFVLRRMRWATMGTIVASREAMEHGLAINLGGGYHHASPDDGHGFSAYADVGLAVHHLRKTGRLSEQDQVVYVDLDAHQGNGVCRTFFEDSRVLIYDQYNRHIFPGDAKAQRRIDCDVPLSDNCSEADYLAALRSRLPAFLDSVSRGGHVRFAIYNAGTDTYVFDQLGGMNLSANGVLERDRFVLHELVSRGMPVLVLLSGGYSRESFELIAQMIEHVLDSWGGLTGGERSGSAH